MLFDHDPAKENAIQFSRFDSESPFSSAYGPLRLEDQDWLSAEHYLYANLAKSPGHANKIKQASSPQEAYKLGNAFFSRKCANWKKVRRVLMTRALYTQAMMYPEVKQALLDTGEEMLLETSAYDHYWGLGRDQRGLNTLGKVWMDIRQKIRDDLKEKQGS
jgi:hypothetical protein